MEYNLSLLTQSAAGYAATISMETIILLSVFVVIFFLNLQYGKSFSISFLLSLLIGLLLFNFIPFLSNLDMLDSQIFQKFDVQNSLLYLGLVLFSFFCLKNCIDTDFSRKKIRRLIHTILMSTTETALLFTALYYVSSHTLSAPLTPLDVLFGLELYAFWWLIVSLITIFITTPN